MLQRRHLVQLAALAPLVPHALAQTSPTSPALPRRLGRLMPIGGAEDRMQDRVVLRRFVELCGGAGARIRVLSAASGDPQAAWRAYRAVFAELGATEVAHLDIADAAEGAGGAVRDVADAVDVDEDVIVADLVDGAFEFADHGSVRRVTGDGFRGR